MTIYLTESLLDVRRKNASHLSDEEFKSLMNFDPLISELPLDKESMERTPESYSKWLLKMKKNGDLLQQSPDKVRKLLKVFDAAKKRKNLLPNNDIFSYKNIDSLEDAIKHVNDNLSKNQLNKNAKKNQKELSDTKEKKPGMYMNGAVELLFNGNDWEVWTPHTYEGSKALRRGASWCTGGDTPNFYNSYTEDGELLVIINKENPKEKYQLFVPFDKGDREREFRDQDNGSVKFREFIHENNELLKFFLTQEIVTNSYEDLEDPTIDDEWSEEREDEVMYQYDLSYNNDGELCIAVDYGDLVPETYWTDYRDYREVASHGYNEGGWSNYDGFRDEVMKTRGFISQIDWEETDLFLLYKYYLNDSKQDPNKMTFKKFLYTLFVGASEGDCVDGCDEELYEWFSTHSDDEFTWKGKVCSCITTTYLASDPIDDFIYNQLQKHGWNPPRDYNNSYSYYNRKNRFEEYCDQFKKYFIITLPDCHSVQDFWENYVDRGEKSSEEFLEDYKEIIIEEEGDIDPDDANYEEYESSRFHIEDAERICELFVSKEDLQQFMEEN